MKHRYGTRCLLLLLIATIGAGCLAGPADAAIGPELVRFGEFGEGAGQLRSSEGTGMVTDPQSGHLFVTDIGNHRVDEFTAWGEFVKAFGWGVRDGSPEPQTCDEQSGCRAGTGGVAGGELNLARGGLARDQAGNLYVFENGTVGLGPGIEFNLRIQVFDPAGDFLRSFGGDVVASGPDDSTNNEIQSVRVAATTGTFKLGFKSPVPGSSLEETAALPYNASAGQLQAAMNALPSIGAAGGSVVVSGGPGNGTGSTPYEIEFQGTVGGDDVVPLSLSGSNLLQDSEVTTVQDGGAPEICVPASGDVCKIGVPGIGPGEFSNFPPRGDQIEFGPNNTLYVADAHRIEEFETDGSYKGEVSFSGIHASNPAFPIDLTPQTLTVDPVSGDLYLSFHFPDGGTSQPVTSWRLTPTGEIVPPAPLLSSAKGADGLAAGALATDSAGDLFAGVAPINLNSESVDFSRSHLLELDPSGTSSDDCCIDPGEYAALTTNVVNAAGGSDLYSLHVLGSELYITVHGPAPDKWPPPHVPPTVDSQFASVVGAESVVLKAEIDPRFWADTRYFLEYGEADCSGGGCTQVPAPPGKLLGAGIVKKSVTTDGILVSGLEPGATYHYRFVAESGGGGPVYGPDETFTTYALPKQPQGECPNASFRIGAAAALADCRAYELVSPVDKNGGELEVPINTFEFPSRLEQSAPDGERITYSAAGSFAGAASASYVSQYLASRGSDGWSTAPISPPRSNGSLIAGNALDSSFKAFLPDLSSGWVLQDNETLLTPDAQPGTPNLYRRDNATGSYEALITASALGAEAGVLEPILQGFSADGRRAVFAVDAKLTSNASNSNGLQLYETFEGAVRLVSLRPNGSAALDVTVGSSFAETGSGVEGRTANVRTAVSAAGDRIYWTESDSSKLDGTGTVYVRVNGTKTVEVAPHAIFWSATPDGSAALFSQEGALKLFDLASKSSSQIATGIEGVLGASDDLSRVYFVSHDDLANGAQAGKLNLYLYAAGSPIRFIATLSPGDRTEGNPSPMGLAPWRHVSWVTPDGNVAVFMSTGSLSGAANVDQQSGLPDAEVFRYDAGSDQLRCLSCSPTGARPSGGRLVGRNPDPDIGSKRPNYSYASRIPGFELEFHAPRVVSSDGTRVFFDSVNRLTLDDTNGREDVYQWEEQGAGECSPSAPGFDAKTGGCVTLISNGQGSTRSEFIDASGDGRDVFFLTGTSLLPQDIAQTDLYDARIGGGFPQPPALPAACEGEACQGPPSPPNDPVPGSSTYRGAGNVREAARHCPKGKRKVRRKGKTRCVRPAKKAHHHRKHHRKPGGSK